MQVSCATFLTMVVSNPYLTTTCQSGAIIEIGRDNGMCALRCDYCVQADDDWMPVNYG